MALPTFLDANKNMMLMQNNWKSQLDPVLGNPMTNPLILKSINLVSGNNVINHLLGQTLQGWLITDTTASSSIYRSAPKNDKTLTLNSSAPCVVDLLVF